MIVRKFILTAFGLVVSAGVSGCAGLETLSQATWPEPAVPDVHPVRKARADAAVASFDRKRNEAQFLAAQSSWRQGDYPRCREALEKVLDRDPNHRASLLLLADVALETDKPDEAVETLRRLTALDPKDAEAAYRLGLSLEAADKLAEAVPYLRQAAATEPHSAKYADALHQAERLVATTAAATQNAANGIAVKPVADAEFAAALADWEAGREAAAAEKVARFLQTHPEHIDANILQAEIDLAAERETAAVARMDKLAAAYPLEPQVCRAFGLILKAKGDDDAAARCFAHTEKLAAAKAGRNEVSGDGAVVSASYITATDEGEAPTAPADAEPGAPEPPVIDDSQADAAELLRRGEAALRDKQLEEAGRLLRAAIDQSGDDPQTALVASVAALKLEQSELSYDLASHAAARFPHSAGLHRVRGMAAYRMRRYAEAEVALRQSLSLDNSQALSYFLLGSALEHLGRPEEGERYRSEAARLDSRYALRK